MRRRLASLALAMLLVASGCASAGGDQVADRLFFGRSIPAGGTVSESDWQQFLGEVVTPRFPDGLTVLSGQGQWRSASGEIVREEVFVVEIFHSRTAEAERFIEEIVREYMERFGQESVARATSAPVVRFY